MKNLSKFVIVSSVVFIVLRGQGEALLQTLYIEPSALGALALAIVGRLLAGSLVAFALPDRCRSRLGHRPNGGATCG